MFDTEMSVYDYNYDEGSAECYINSLFVKEKFLFSAICILFLVISYNFIVDAFNIVKDAQYNLILNKEIRSLKSEKARLYNDILMLKAEHYKLQEHDTKPELDRTDKEDLVSHNHHVEARLSQHVTLAERVSAPILTSDEMIDNKRSKTNPRLQDYYPSLYSWLKNMTIDQLKSRVSASSLELASANFVNKDKYIFAYILDLHNDYDKYYGKLIVPVKNSFSKTIAKLELSRVSVTQSI